MARGYDAIRDFLALHYRFNRRLDTPFWHACLNDVKLHRAQRYVDFYVENGPSLLGRSILFEDTDPREYGAEGFLAMLVGQCVPYRSAYKPSAEDRWKWSMIQNHIKTVVDSAYSVPEALALIRSDAWNWPEKLYDRPRGVRR